MEKWKIHFVSTVMNIRIHTAADHLLQAARQAFRQFLQIDSQFQVSLPLARFFCFFFLLSTISLTDW